MNAYVATMNERRAIADSIGGLLVAFTGEHVGEPRLLICLYGPPLVQVDLKFVTLEDLRSLVERPRLVWARESSTVEECLERADVAWPNRSPQWFEDRAWIWLQHGAAKLLRGELFEAIGMLAFIREQILGPMFHRAAGGPSAVFAESRRTRGQAPRWLRRSRLSTAVPRWWRWRGRSTSTSNCGKSSRRPRSRLRCRRRCGSTSTGRGRVRRRAGSRRAQPVPWGWEPAGAPVKVGASDSGRRYHFETAVSN